MNKLDKELWGGEAVFDALLEDIRNRREEFESQGYMSQDIIERFKEIGIYRAFVPKEFGGDEKTPMEFLTAIEALASADGSAGWVASFGVAVAYLGSLPLETIKQVWADTPDVVFAGGVFPPQQAKPVEGGYIVNGRWPFGSGSMGASLIGVSIKRDDDSPLPSIAVFPADKVIKDQSTWKVQGMTGTGSFDMVVEDVFVADEWMFTRGGKSSLDSDFSRYPSLSIAAQVLAVTSLGVAREALDMISKRTDRKSITGGPSIGKLEWAQIDIAKAEAKLQSARAFFYNATTEVWNATVTEGKASNEQISMVRLATTNVAQECAEVVRTAYKIGGMSSTYYSSHLSRCFRDSHMATQHAFMSPLTYKNAGAMIFGHEPLPGYL